MAAFAAAATWQKRCALAPAPSSSTRLHVYGLGAAGEAGVRRAVSRSSGLIVRTLNCLACGISLGSGSLLIDAPLEWDAGEFYAANGVSAANFFEAFRANFYKWSRYFGLPFSGAGRQPALPFLFPPFVMALLRNEDGAHGLSPALMRTVTDRESTSTTATSFDGPFAVYSVRPSGDIAMPHGRSPTSIVDATVFVLVSMMATLLPRPGSRRCDCRWERRRCPSASADRGPA